MAVASPKLDIMDSHWLLMVKYYPLRTVENNKVTFLNILIGQMLSVVVEGTSRYVAQGECGWHTKKAISSFKQSCMV